MHRDAFDAIEARQGAARHPLVVANDLYKLIAAVRRGEKVLSETPASRDQHAKRGASELTRYVVNRVEYLTGTPVTRISKSVPIYAHLHGPKEGSKVHELLDEVLELFDFDAKAAGQIKLLKAEKARRKKAS